MESKKISDYLHLYLGAEIYYPETKEISTSCWTHILDLATSKKRGEEWNPSFILVLRSLSDMTEEDYAFINDGYNNSNKHSRYGSYYWESEQTRYLLSKHFDLFDLIPSGLAIDKNTLK